MTLPPPPMRGWIATAVVIYLGLQVAVVVDMKGDYSHLGPLHLLRPGAIIFLSVRYFRGYASSALWLSIWAGTGIIRTLVQPPVALIGYGESLSQLSLAVVALLALRAARRRDAREIFGNAPEEFQPDFPLVPLFASEDEARRMTARHGSVQEEDPDDDHRSTQKILVAESAGTRISVGIRDGRMRYTNYLKSNFNGTDEAKGKKLGWFVAHYGGTGEFDPPNDTGHMIFWRNPHKKIMIVFGNLLGPVRIIDQDPAHWPDNDQASVKPSGP